MEETNSMSEKTSNKADYRNCKDFAEAITTGFTVGIENGKNILFALKYALFCKRDMKQDVNVLKKILAEIDVEIEEQKQICSDMHNTPGWRLYEKTARIMRGIVEKYLRNVSDINVGDNGWIPVTKQLPERGKSEYDWVLALPMFVPEEVYGVPHVAEFYNGTWHDFQYEDFEKECNVKVTHWRPLPEPLKESDNNAKF